MLSETQQVSSTSERLDWVKLIRIWGGVNTDGLLDENCKRFFYPGIEGFIGYRLEGSQAVVLGDPVCSQGDWGALAKAFQEDCTSKNIGVVYIMASKEFSDWALAHLSPTAIEWGEVYICDPMNNPLNGKGAKACLVRKKVKHAANDGVVIHEYLEGNPALEKQLEEVGEAWLKKRYGAQIYLSPLNLFKDRYGKRWFYAQQGDKITGVLVLNQLSAKEGWLLNNLMISREAAKGVSEFLVVSTLQALEKEHCRYVLIGPEPVNELREITGTNKFYAAFTRWLYTCARCVFHLDGHTAFWHKFQPDTEGSYLLFPHKNLNLSSIRSILKALNAG